MVKFYSRRDRVLTLSMMVLAFLLGTAAHAQSTGKLVFPDETDSQVLEWGQETAEDFLTLHQMSKSEVSTISTYARQDLRDSLRAFAWTKMQALLVDPDATLDPLEQRVVDRYREVLKSVGTEYIQIAKQEKDRFLSNRCTWKPDADLAKSSGFSFDGAYYCPRAPYQPIFNENPPMSPTKDFFFAYGQKKAWVDPLVARPGGLRSIAHISAGGTLFLSIGLAAALAISTSIALTFKLVSKLSRLLSMTRGIKDVGWGSFWVGLAISIAIALVTIAIVIFLYTENIRIEGEYSQIDSQYASVMANPAPSRALIAASIANDQAYRALYIAFLRMTLPTSALPTPPALPSATSADPQFAIQVPGGSGFTRAESITFPGWDGERTTIRPYGGWLLQRALVPIPNIDLTSINTRIRYQWYGKKYEADRMGGYFAVRKSPADATDVECPPAAGQRVSSAPNLTRCSTFVTTALEMDLESVGRRIVSITQPVAFTSASSTKVSLNTASAFLITTTGLPEATITSDSTLPAGFTLTAGSILGTANLNWNGTGSPTGNYVISLRANNGVEATTQTVDVQVTDQIRFAAPATTSVTVEHGTYVSIPVVATGFPQPSMEVTYNGFAGNCGLRSVEYGTGVVHLEGTVLPPNAPAVKCIFAVRAHNGFQEQQFLDVSIVVTPPSAQPVLIAPDVDTPAGLPRQYAAAARTTGVTVPVSISISPDANGNQAAPSWVSLRDEGNGTATLTVTPPNNAPEQVFVPIWHRVVGSDGNLATRDRDGLTIRIHRKPLFSWTSGSNIARFDAGSLVDQSWGAQAYDSSSSATIRSNPALPAGLSFQMGQFGAFVITGRAKQATDLTTDVTVANAYGETTAPVRIIVAEAARVNSAMRVHFYAGRANQFEVTASGFPITPLGEAGRYIPAAMRLWMDSDSQAFLQTIGLQFVTTDASTSQPLYGRALITGSPTTMGSWLVKINAQTAGLATDVQTFNVVSTVYGDVNGDFKVSCEDVNFLNARLGRRRGSAEYDYNADVNQDGVIDVRDVALVSARLPSGTRCQ